MRKENDTKELNLHDLTPALMKELEQLNSADAIVSFLKEKGFAASQEISERIYNKLHGVKILRKINFPQSAADPMMMTTKIMNRKIARWNRRMHRIMFSKHLLADNLQLSKRG